MRLGIFLTYAACPRQEASFIPDPCLQARILWVHGLFFLQLLFSLGRSRHPRVIAVDKFAALMLKAVDLRQSLLCSDE